MRSYLKGSSPQYRSRCSGNYDMHSEIFVGSPSLISWCELQSFLVGPGWGKVAYCSCPVFRHECNPFACPGVLPWMNSQRVCTIAVKPESNDVLW
eukprot:3590442-Amphidinium_carterae.1